MAAFTTSQTCIFQQRALPHSPCLFSMPTHCFKLKLTSKLPRKGVYKPHFLHVISTLNSDSNKSYICVASFCLFSLLCWRWQSIRGCYSGLDVDSKTVKEREGERWRAVIWKQAGARTPAVELFGSLTSDKRRRCETAGYHGNVWTRRTASVHVFPRFFFFTFYSNVFSLVKHANLRWRVSD